MRGIGRMLSLLGYGIGIVAAIQCGTILSQHPLIGSLSLMASGASIALGYYIWTASNTFSR